MITLTTAQNALKTVYLDAVSAQLNGNIDPIFNSIKQSSSDVYGRSIIKLVPYGLNGGVGTGTEDGALPLSHETNYVNFTTTLKNLYGTIEISDKAIRASANDEGAFVNLLTAEIDNLLESSKFNLARMFYGDGTGSLCLIVSISAPARTMTVDNSAPFMQGMLLDFYIDGILDPSMQGVMVTNVDVFNKVITLDRVSNSFTNANSSKYKVYIQGSKDRELTGLGALFSNSQTLYGLTRASYSALMPLSRSITSADFNEMTVQKAIDDIEARSNRQPNVMVTASTLYYSIISDIASYSKNIDSSILEGGVESVALSGVPLVRNKFCADNKLMILNTDLFILHQLCDWEWLNYNDGSILRQKEGYPTYSATLVKYADLVCNRPNAQGILTVGGA